MGDVISDCEVKPETDDVECISQGSYFACRLPTFTTEKCLYQLPSPWLGVFSNMFAETVNLGSEK